jgi:hypothetical protein
LFFENIDRKEDSKSAFPKVINKKQFSIVNQLCPILKTHNDYKKMIFPKFALLMVKIVLQEGFDLSFKPVANQSTSI